jgi:hypothetical protein
VRVVNAANSKDEQFYVAWSGERMKSQSSSETAVYVPAGQSCVVKLPRPEESLAADRIMLRGDDDEFDNTFFVVPPRKQQITILYFGDDAAKDRQGQRYYLEIATIDDPLRQVKIETPTASDASKLLTTQPTPQVAVVTTKLPSQVQAALKHFVEGGGTLVLAPEDEEAGQDIASLVDDIGFAAKPASSDYLLLGEIDFSHPLFAPFANPRYSDFTKIHFWKHRPLTLKENAQTKVVASFDSGEPAIMERVLGRGRIIIFASGWQPEESQLALSTKFVPMMGALLDLACGPTASLDGVTVGEAVDIAAIAADQALVVHKPDGAEATVGRGAASFADADQPGVYEIRGGTTPALFAVNLAAAESNTAPLELEKLEQLGINMKSVLSRKHKLDRKRQERDTELESRQKIWRWLLAGALGVLVFETFLAGRAAQQIATAEALA